MTFQPGQSGNPAGRPRGSRNKRTIIAEQLLDDRAGDVTQAAIDLATSGHGPTLRMCMDRIAPPLRHRLLDFALPELRTAADAVVAANAIVQGVAHGELTIPEATGLMKLVRGFIAVLAVADRETRIARLEARDGVVAARPPEHDSARDHEDPILLPQCPPPDSVEPMTARATNHADLELPVPPARSCPRERTRDRAARRPLLPPSPSLALEALDRAAWDDLRSPKSIVPTERSAGLGLFRANPKTVEASSMIHAEIV